MFPTALILFATLFASSAHANVACDVRSTPLGVGVVSAPAIRPETLSLAAFETGVIYRFTGCGSEGAFDLRLYDAYGNLLSPDSRVDFLPVENLLVLRGTAPFGLDVSVEGARSHTGLVIFRF